MNNYYGGFQQMYQQYGSVPQASSKLTHMWHTFLGDLEHKLYYNNNPILLNLCRSLRLPKSKVVVYGALSILLVVQVLFGSNQLCHLVGFVYPFYASFKAIESPQGEDDTVWLTYWVVFGWFILVESFTDLFMSRIPAYFYLKMLFLVWCYMPQTRGAKWVHRLLFRHLHKNFLAVHHHNRYTMHPTTEYHYQAHAQQPYQPPSQAPAPDAPAKAKIAERKPSLHHSPTFNHFEEESQRMNVDVDKAFPVSGVLKLDEGDAQPRFWINLHRGMGLKIADSNGASDPYVKIYWKGDDRKDMIWKSEVVKENLNPEWNERIPFEWGPPNFDTLVVDVWDEDWFNDDFLGRAEIKVDKMTPYINQFKLKPREDLKGTKNEDKGIIGFVVLSFNVTKLQVDLDHAVNVKKADIGGKSDPYCELYWEGTEKTEPMQVSSIQYNTLDPKWKQSFVLDWMVPYHTSFVIDCWDWDKIGRDFLGRCILDVRTMKTGGRECQLQKRAGKNDSGIRGHIFIGIKRLSLDVSMKKKNNNDNGAKK